MNREQARTILSALHSGPDRADEREKAVDLVLALLESNKGPEPTPVLRTETPGQALNSAMALMGRQIANQQSAPRHRDELLKAARRTLDGKARDEVGRASGELEQVVRRIERELDGAPAAPKQKPTR